MQIFYFDRQEIIQSDGIDFIQDLLQFLILLLVFQRSESRDWGVIPELNSPPSLVHNLQPPVPPRREPTVQIGVVEAAMEVEFKARNTVIEKFNLDVKACMVIAWTWNDDGNISPAQVTGEANNVVDPTNITLKPRSFVSHQPHSLAGRATAVINASIERLGRDAVCKISNPEVQRTNG